MDMNSSQVKSTGDYTISPCRYHPIRFLVEEGGICVGSFIWEQRISWCSLNTTHDPSRMDTYINHIRCHRMVYYMSQIDDSCEHQPLILTTNHHMTTAQPTQPRQHIHPGWTLTTTNDQSPHDNSPTHPTKQHIHPGWTLTTTNDQSPHDNSPTHPTKAAYPSRMDTHYNQRPITTWQQPNPPNQGSISIQDGHSLQLMTNHHMTTVQPAQPRQHIHPGWTLTTTNDQSPHDNSPTCPTKATYPSRMDTHYN